MRDKLLELKSNASILENLVDINDISQIVYRKDDYGVACFKHIDIECVCGEYLEILEGDRNYIKILDLFQITDLEKEEVILFERH
ncbi:MAG: hypothetical protein IJA36_11535 [Lachnospiraceae bacterium]|nr:hypothetical protein [Lachnospiraceae bacterium]